MPSALMRRSAWTAAVATVLAIASPLMSHASAATAPQFDASNSTPGPGESVIAGSETLTAAFDQPVTGDQNSFKVFEVNANGARGQQLPGTVTFDAGTPPVTGPGDTVTWKPEFTLVIGEYEAVLSVNGFDSSGNKDPNSVGTADYDFYVAGSGAPTNLQGPAWVNNQNFQSVPFTGVAAPGLTITVTVNGNDATTGHLPQSATGTAVVPTCAAAPACPWTVNVDMSDDNPAGPSPAFADSSDGSMTWTAQGSEPESSSIKTNASAAQPQKQDTQPPTKPTIANNPSINAANSAVTVPDASDTDASTIGYTITITDADSHSVSQDAPAGSGSTHTMPQQVVDVSGLDDGTLTVHIDARDAAGNLSGDANAAGGSSAPTVTKAAGTIPNLTTSTFTTPAGTTTFADAATHAIQAPTSIDLEFTEPIMFSYEDNQLKTHNSSVSIASANGNPIFALTLAASQTGRGIIATVPKGTTIPAATYTVAFTVYPSSGCSINPVSGTGTCATFGGVVRNGSNLSDYGAGSQTPLLQWTVDTTPPTITISHLDNPITPTTDQSAGIAGSVDTDVSAIQLTLVSSNAPTHQRIASIPVNAGKWSEFPLPLSGVVDGTLSLALKATDAAGLSTTVTRQVVLNALNLHVIPGDTKALVTWSKPTLANNATPTYTLIYRDQSVANAPATTLTPGPAATSTLLSGLTNGHNYGVTLTATDPNGNGPAAVGSATPRTASRLTVTTSASSITYGTTISVHGRLTDAAGRPLAGRTLTVYPVYAGGRKGTISRPKTNSTGNWSVSSKPVANATYHIGFAGDAADKASSARRSVTVRVAIRITSVSAKNSSHTTAVRIAGTVAPNEHGRHVYVYEVRGGKNVRIATLTLSSTSTFVYSHAWSRGTHVVFVNFPSQNGITGANSSKVTFSRT